MLLLFSLLTTSFSSLNGQDISSCCTSVLIQSSGEAQTHQRNRLGEYRLTGIYNERPLYTSVTSKNGDEFLFYLRSKNKGLWMVGPESGQFNGGLAHRGDSPCVEDVAAGQWKFTDGKSWNRDQEIQVTCLDSAEEGVPRCVYEDQMTFIGEDLPEVFGGGGVETNQETSAECIDLCERTSGCKYWTWIMDEKVNCFLKKNLLSSERRPKHVSGSDPSACSVTSPVVTTPVTTPVTTTLTTEQTAEPKYNENEINGKFKIMMGWDDKFNDPESKEYQDLANTIETDLEDMLRKERDLSEQVESFTVKVEQFRRGSVVCDFKVNYILKEAYIAIPFAIKPANITTAMGNSFKIKKGILFQRFLIAGGSFNASSPVDHCSSKGCSHKCNYDYSLEDYVCTCPPTLQLASDGLTCLQEPEVSSRLPEIEVSFLPSDCLWSPWSDWSDCSVCGAPGKRERKRTILVPEKNGGTCVGRDQEFVECNEICETGEAPLSTTQQPSVEIVTSVSVDTGVNGEGRQDSIDTTLPDEVTEKAMEDLEPETGMDIEADQPSETTTVTFTEETSGEVEQGEVQSTEEAEQTTETTTDNVKETDEGIIYPVPEIPTEAQETTTPAEKEDVVMSTESMIEMTTEADIEITTAKEMDPIVQYTTTIKQVVDTSSETTMEDTVTEKVMARDGLDIEESMDTTTLASVSDAVIPMETTASAMEEDNADDIQTTTASIQEEVTEADPAEVVTSTPSASTTESTEVEATSEINENETTTKQDAPSETTTENQTVEDMTDGARNDLDISATVTTTLPSSTEGLSPMETTAGEVEVTSGEPTTISSSEENTSPAETTTEMSMDEAPVTSSVTESPKEMTPAEEEMEMETTAATEAVTELTVDEVTSTTEDIEAVTEKVQSKLPRIDTAAEMAMTTSPTIEEKTDIESLSQVVEVTTPREDIVTATTVKDEELTTVADVKMIMSEDAEIKEDSNTEVDMQTTTEKVDMEENVEEVITEKNIMMEVTTEENNMEEEKIMESITTEKERMEEVTTEKESIEEVTTEKGRMEEVITEKESMEEVITEKESMEEVITEKESMEDLEPETGMDIEADQSSETTTVTLIDEIINKEESMEEVTTEKESMVEITTENMKTTMEEITTEKIMEPIPEEVTTTEEVTKEKMETSEEVTTEKIIEMVETTSMEPVVEMTTVEVVAISEEEDELSVVTTVRPRLDESVVRTTVQPAGEDQEFLCHPAAEPDQEGDMPMSCVHLSGDEERSIMLLIPREVIGDISLNRLFDKNVKIVVRDFMVMDRSPRRL